MCSGGGPYVSVMQLPPASSLRGDLSLADLLRVAGVATDDVLLVRHTYSPDGLTGPHDATVEKVLAYTRVQSVRQSKIPRDPPAVWLNFMADGKRRSRFLVAYENKGEVLAERTDVKRYFDLHPSDVLASLRNRLVVEWSNDTINWAKAGARADQMPVVEIADPARVPFPGFDDVLITHDELVAVAEDSRYTEWRTALAAVQGIYLVADTSSGDLYVGKADGRERCWVGGAPTPATATAATSRSANSPRSTRPTGGTSSSASCGCSGRARPPPRSMRQRRTTSGRSSPGSTA